MSKKAWILRYLPAVPRKQFHFAFTNTNISSSHLSDISSVILLSQNVCDIKVVVKFYLNENWVRDRVVDSQTHILFDDSMSFHIIQVFYFFLFKRGESQNWLFMFNWIIPN